MVYLLYLMSRSKIVRVGVSQCLNEWWTNDQGTDVPSLQYILLQIITRRHTNSASQKIKMPGSRIRVAAVLNDYNSLQ
jgi:hypothetical protein